MVSQYHAKIVVGSTVEIIDDNSANGIISSGQNVQRLILADGDICTLGDTIITIDGIQARVETPDLISSTVAFNRSPRLEVRYVGEELDAPDLPEPQRTQPIPIVALLIPLLMAPVLYYTTHSWASLSFIALSPLMMVGNFLYNGRSAQASFKEDVANFENNLAALVTQLRRLQDEERSVRRQEYPSTSEVVEAVRGLTPLTWSRRPEHESFLALRLGLGAQTSRTTVALPPNRKSPPEFLQQLREAVDPFLKVDGVPIVCHLPTEGALGISGPAEVRGGVAAGVVAQLVGLHSPAELCLFAIVSPHASPNWDWIKWLPHVDSEYSPIEGTALANTVGSIAPLVASLIELLAQRSDDGVSTSPHIIVIVDDEAPFSRSQLVQLAEEGAVHGIYVIWMADGTEELPAVCRTFLELAPGTFGAATGKVIDMERVQPVVVETLDAKGAEWFGRRLAPVYDASSAVDGESNVPDRVSFVSEAGLELLDDPSFVIDRWTESNSLRLPGMPLASLRRDNTLRALVGRTDSDALYLDLRTQGPHALVGGTTGAGKSEFLQTWVLAMAAAHSSQRVNFLFVDYKGGAAFADCVNLPHSVGLVTDLSPHLVQRALISLNAELRFREHILNKKKAKDLMELERRQDPDTPPSLVIVVDEFAALVQEVPEFVDGVVNVAQRGRSLGLHLILATQRPAGVIKGNLRANTNLRVALRMADDHDSVDVIGTSQAGKFDPGIPGRGAAKTGPGRLSLFQTGYVGAITTGRGPTARIAVRDLEFGGGQSWELAETAVDAPASTDDTPRDISRVVSTVCAATQRLSLPAPRRPWLPELASLYDLSALPTKRTDAELVFGVLDQPGTQSQGTVAFRPDVDGSMVVFGTGGAGKSTALRSLAAAAGLSARGGPCNVYGLDFGSRGLAMLEVLPHVGSVIPGDDVERVGRLLRQLRQTLDRRAEQFSAVNAGSIEDYRALANAPGEPRLLLLLDGYPSFRSAFEAGQNAWMLDTLQALAGDGRPLGIHVIITADRPGSVPAGLASSIQKRLVMRMATDSDASAIEGVPRDGFGENSPPGRAFLEGQEVQVAIFGGRAEPTGQARALGKLADSMGRAGTAVAPPVASLPEHVPLADLHTADSGLPAFAIADETLQPIGFEPSGAFLIAGPPGSGRSTAILTMATALSRYRPDVELVYFGHTRSPLAGNALWSHAGLGPEEGARLALRYADEIKAREVQTSPVIIVLDSIGEFLSSDADIPLQNLMRICRSAGVFVLAEGPTSDVSGSWPLLQSIKAFRYGLVLQPDQQDGDLLFRTSFPRVRRSEFPAGRGLLVHKGRSVRIQVAIP
jgi:S-DNA-T family DNA segregation ATPase FtsK/SpoIIIE